MVDYSLFPWQEFTEDEIAHMALRSDELGDREFAQACVDEIKRRKPHQEKDLTPPDSFPTDKFGTGGKGE